MWGARLKLFPNPNLYIEGAALQVNPIVNTSHGGTYFGFYGATGTELPFEVGLTLRNEHGDGVGNIRVGGYYDTSNVLGYTSRERDELSPTDPSDTAALATLPAEYVRGRSGAYVQLDHLIAGSSLPHRFGTAIFLAAEYSDPNTALLTSYIDTRIVRHGTFRNRPNDTLAFGFAAANYN
jgi:porin